MILFWVIIINSIFLGSIFLFQNILYPLIILFFLLTMSFIFYPQNDTFVDRFRTKFFTYLQKDYHYIVIVVAVLIFFYLRDLIGFNASLIAGFFILTYFLKLDDRAAFVVALFFLIICPLLLIYPDSELAEKAAVSAYYFLVIGVVWQIINLIRQKKEIEAEIKNPVFVSKHLAFRKTLNKKQTSFYIGVFFIFFISFCSSAALFLLSYSFINHYQKVPKIAISPTPPTTAHLSPTLSPNIKTVKPVLAILNGSGIAGQAASASAFLKKMGWNDKLDINVDNADRSDYNGVKLKYLLKYQTIAKELSRDLIKIKELDAQQINLVSFNEATSSGDLILIIGKHLDY